MKKEKQNLLIFLGLVVGCAILIFGVISPAICGIKEDNRKINEEKTKTAELIAKGNSISRNRQNLTKVEQESNVLEKPFLRTGEELNFITDLESRADKSGVEQIIYFDDTKGVEDKNIKKIPLELQLSSGLDNLISYINSLEELDYYINISEINITSGSHSEVRQRANQIREDDFSEGDLTLSVKIKALTYWE